MVIRGWRDRGGRNVGHAPAEEELKIQPDGGGLVMDGCEWKRPRKPQRIPRSCVQLPGWDGQTSEKQEETGRDE